MRHSASPPRPMPSPTSTTATRSTMRRHWPTVPHCRVGSASMSPRRLSAARQPTATCVLLQPVRDRGEARIGAKRRWILESVEPGRELRGRIARLLLRNAEALERDDPGDAAWPHAGILHDDVAAEAVPDEPRGRIAG